MASIIIRAINLQRADVYLFDDRYARARRERGAKSVVDDDGASHTAAIIYAFAPMAPVESHIAPVTKSELGI